MDMNEQIAALKLAKKRRQQALAWHLSGKSLKEIGVALGVTRERARQLVAAANREAGKTKEGA